MLSGTDQRRLREMYQKYIDTGRYSEAEAERVICSTFLQDFRQATQRLRGGTVTAQGVAKDMEMFNASSRG